MGDLNTRTCISIVGYLAVNLSIGTSYINQCICGFLLNEGKFLPIHSHPVVVLMTLLEVMLLFEEDVRDDAIVNGLGILRNFACSVERSTTVRQCT